ncbi:MAG: hypothetical protein AB1750_00435, partial [Chloroflexota bacterium]
MNSLEEPTSDPDLIARVRARYAAELNELRALEFREVCFVTESLGPFSLLLQFRMALLMRANGEVTTSRPPLRIAAGFALLGCQGIGAYAQPMGMGVKFYTGFTDGSALVTCNFVSQDVSTPRLVKFGRPQPLAWAWAFHQKQIEQLRAQGREVLSHLS